MSVPVLIIGGFLGAGKTTALNHLLRHAGERVAVLVNDFGALDIDAHLLSGNGEIFALANGCVCCAIGPDFSATLSRILTMEPAPERILVEASGVSDPWRIAQLVKLNRAARLDAVVVLADALELPAQFADRWLRDTLERQIARADIVALNKCDIADAEAKAAAHATLFAIRPGVTVIETANGVLPKMLLSTNKDENTSTLIADAPAHGLRSWSWAPPGALDEARLRTALDGLPGSIWRGKGFLSIGGEKSRRLLQLVGRRWTLTDYDGGPAADRLVLIGTEDMPADRELDERFVGALI